MKQKILIVEDEIPFSMTLEALLRGAGYEPLVANTAEDGLELARLHWPALVLLDVMIPAMGGWALCQRIREFSAVPVVFLTAVGDTDSVVKGLKLGADDYLVKPVKSAELLARVWARLRRLEQAATASTDSFGNGELVINRAAHQVWVRGREVELRPREYDMLLCLVDHADEVVTTVNLAMAVWGWADDTAVGGIKTYIHHLRRKIEADPALPRWIQTVRGVGYRFRSG
ncbi:MAG: response regulator transcription factor [Chloroflexi bacterium]|nr:response regulator transcription factor [Ardenticatenaceae bacterium]MBL1128829.1 DNA-binding response regulator [Chloroflexota bacterium]NOG34907.1 response regulator transcription factor [Chloroflexota bacterium]GIK58070.1 MAG: DNA-binding response regulator [Chloroflexota bacterium]